MIPESKTGLKSYTPNERRELYKTNPELFDRLAAEAINQACIGETPEETLKLQQMQLTIDALLSKANTQPERMKMMENIFYSHVFGSNGNLAHLVDSCLELAHTASDTEKVPTGKPALFLVRS